MPRSATAWAETLLRSASGPRWGPERENVPVLVVSIGACRRWVRAWKARAASTRLDGRQRSRGGDPAKRPLPALCRA
jgi:hypothetical protein